MRRTNITLCVVGLIAIIGAYCTSLGAFELALLVQILAIVIAATVVIVVSKRGRLRLSPLSISLLVSIAVLVSIALVGFYTKSSVVGEFDGGGTWVPDRSLPTALESSFIDPSSFIASLFGYNCNSTYGTNCAPALYLTGFGISEIVLIIGAVVGNTLVKRQMSH